MNIVKAAPPWVWPLLLLLLYIGWRASRPRETSLLFFYLMPLLGLISVNTLVRLPQASVALPAFAACWAIGAAAGHALQPRWLIAKRDGTVRLAGEWLTMSAILTIFCANFANGAVAALAPELARAPLYLLAFAGLTGLSSGSFLGRAAYVLRCPSRS